MNGVIIGVDGGGTKTLAVACQMDGTILAAQRGVGINYNNIGMDQARDNLAQVIDGLLQQCGQDYAEICIGMPALDMAADEATTCAFAGKAFDPARLDMQSDAYTALQGFTLGKPGIIVICGTGSILLLMDENAGQHVRGGWGHMLGDRGSSHAIASAGLSAAIDSWEHVGPDTALCEAALRHFCLSHPRQLIDRVYTPECGPHGIASFAKEVLLLAARGDQAAYAIVEKEMKHVAAQVAAMIEEHPEAFRVGMYGGVFAHNPLARDLFCSALCARIPHAQVSQPEYPPELGALIHSFQKHGWLNDQVLSNMKESYAALQAQGL